MIKDILVEAEARANTGKGHARRLRIRGMIPIAVYGEGKEPVAAAVNSKDLTQILRSATGHNTIFKLKVGGSEPSNVIIKECVLDPVKGKLLHADLMRLSMTTATRVSVPVEIIGDPVGVRVEGGILEIGIREVEIECLPGDIPHSIKLDVSEFAIGQHATVADLIFDLEKIKMLSDTSQQIASILHPRLVEAPAPAEPVEAAASEPEVIKKGKGEEGQ